MEHNRLFEHRQIFWHRNFISPKIHYFKNNILSPRTCVEPRLEFNSANELLINYREQTISVSEKSDQGPACVNTVEAVYLVSAIVAILTGIGIVHE